MKKQRVCFYSIASGLGGAERSLLDLVSSLETFSQGKYLPTVLLCKGEGPLVDQFKERGVSYEVIPLPESFLKISRRQCWKYPAQMSQSLLALRAHLKEVSEWVREHQISLIHTTGLKCHLLSRFLKVDCPILWHFRDFVDHPIYRPLFHHLSKSSQIRLCANSKAVANAFASAAKDVEVIYNGLDAEKYRRIEADIFREKYGIATNTPIIGILGVLARWKGQVEFIEMAQRLIQEGVKAHFVIIGDEIYDTLGDRGLKQQLQETVEKYGIQGLVHFWGFEKNSIAAVSSLDILVHASIDPEPFGRVVIEGMALKTPVLASGAGGVLEIIRDGKTGVLFAPREIEGMVSGVKKLLNGEIDRNHLIKSGREDFEKRFSLQSHLEHVVRYYDQLL